MRECVFVYVCVLSAVTSVANFAVAGKKEYVRIVALGGVENPLYILLPIAIFRGTGENYSLTALSILLKIP